MVGGGLMVGGGQLYNLALFHTWLFGIYLGSQSLGKVDIIELTPLFTYWLATVSARCPHLAMLFSVKIIASGKSRIPIGLRTVCVLLAKWASVFRHQIAIYRA